jgi:long-chain fatty acid transport protein
MKRQLSLVVGVALLGGSGVAFGITDIENNASIPFNLSNPGARSMGMGGAFLGLADDATAAYTNPAGLTQLVTPEISVEARHSDYSLPFINGGTASVSPFNGSGLQTSNADSSQNNLSFLSVVYPHDRWSFAFYRDELVRFQDNYATSLQGQEVPTVGTAFPTVLGNDLKIIDYGFAVAWKASDAISIGAGVSYYDFNVNTTVQRLNFTANDVIPNVPPGTLLNQQNQFGSDNDIGFDLGARLVFSDQWSAGLVYRRGPSFSYDATSTAFYFTSGDPISPPAVASYNNIRFKVPDEYGAGLSWHPTDALVVNFDADFIEYSQLTRGIQSLFGNDPAVVSQLSIPNGTELHLGGEYTFTQMAHPFSLRAGYWHDPRHSIQFTGDPGTNLGAVALAVQFAGGKGSQSHGALGMGWAFSKFQIDAAADFSDLTDLYSVSAVYHF